MNVENKIIEIELQINKVHKLIVSKTKQVNIINIFIYTMTVHTINDAFNRVCKLLWSNFVYFSMFNMCTMMFLSRQSLYSVSTLQDLCWFCVNFVPFKFLICINKLFKYYDHLKIKKNWTLAYLYIST